MDQKMLQIDTKVERKKYKNGRMGFASPISIERSDICA